MTPYPIIWGHSTDAGFGSELHAAQGFLLVLHECNLTFCVDGFFVVFLDMGGFLWGKVILF